MMKSSLFPLPYGIFGLLNLIQEHLYYVAGVSAGYFEITATSAGITGSATISLKESTSPRKLAWRGQIPPQKWTNFYLKVLTKFAASQDLDMTLNVTVTVEAKGGGHLSEQKIEETKIALRELGLDDEVEVG